MKRKIYLLLTVGSCLATIDATAMFIRRLPRTNVRSFTARRFMHVPANDPVKKHTFNKMFDAQNNKGETPLHIAILNYATHDGDDVDLQKKHATVYALLGGYPNPFIENKDGVTPLQLGKQLEQDGNSEISPILNFLEKYEKAYYEDVHSTLKE